MAIGANAYAVSFVGSLPKVTDLDSANFKGDTLIYDRNGKLLADVGAQGDRRVSVSLDQVSVKVVQATIAIEDRNFWSNPGFDLEGMVRAATSNLRSGGIVGGGSTISQQLAKRLFLSPDQTFDRKLKELVLAYQLNQTYSKRDILQLYLNESYYGEQQYGVQAAAQAFFNKNAKDVSLAEAAMLAGLPQSPTIYSPVQNLDAAKRRQKQVLDAMVEQGYVSEDQARAAFAEELKVNKPQNKYLAPHFVEYVKSRIRLLGYTAGQHQLKVKTTLDWGKQELAERVVRDNLNANKGRDPKGLLSSAMVALDPKTGEILAYVGSPDYNAVGGQYDFVGVEPRNPGSSVKPFTYSLAIESRKATMDTLIADSPSPYLVPQPNGTSHKVENYDKKSHGTPPVRVALAGSLNIPAVKVQQAVGTTQLVEWYRKLGMRPRVPQGQKDGRDTYITDAPGNAFGTSLTLGGFPITLLEEATAVSVLASLGNYRPPEAILEVIDAKGRPIYKSDPERGKRQVMNPGTAFIIGQILSDDSNRAPIFGPGSPLVLKDRKAAAKTGTNENYKDALTLGWTPDLAAVYWIGDILGPDHFMAKDSDAIRVAAPAWNRFMSEALKGVPGNRWYDQPPEVTKQGNSWYLLDATKIEHLPGDSIPSPSPSGNSYGVPPDPGVGPRPLPSLPTRDPRLPTLFPTPGF